MLLQTLAPNHDLFAEQYCLAFSITGILQSLWSNPTTHGLVCRQGVPASKMNAGKLGAPGGGDV